MKSKFEDSSNGKENIGQSDTNNGDLRQRKVNEEPGDKTLPKSSTQENEDVKSIVELGGSFSVLCQVVVTIVSTAIICIICDNSRSIDEFKDWNVWFSWRSVLIYSSYLFLQGFLAFVPYFGKKITLPDSGVIYTANGVFILFVTLFIMISLECFNIPIFRWIYEEYYSLYVVSIIIGTLLSICAYIKGGNVPDKERNVYGNSGSFIYDFCMGRQVNTYFFGKINLKLFLLRCAVTASILHNLAFLYLDMSMDKSTGSISVNPTLLAFVFLPCFYLVCSLATEDILHLTFEYHGEGAGVISLVGYGLYPYNILCVGKCILEHNIHLSPMVLYVAMMLSLLGQYIHYKSNDEKNTFRANPDDPKNSSFTSIETSSGSRLLTSGWWGYVRHPNYFGEIIIHFAWCIPVLTKPLASYGIIMVLYFMWRAKRDGERCHRKHGAAWETYCKKVPYSIIPGLL